MFFITSPPTHNTDLSHTHTHTSPLSHICTPLAPCKTLTQTHRISLMIYTDNSCTTTCLSNHIISLSYLITLCLWQTLYPSILKHIMCVMFYSILCICSPNLIQNSSVGMGGLNVPAAVSPLKRSSLLQFTWRTT